MAFLLFCAFFAVITGVVARAKGMNWALWGLIGAIPPFIGVIAVVLHRDEAEELRRECPGCGRVTKIYDAICTRCGTELDFPEVAIESERMAAERRARSGEPVA